MIIVLPTKESLISLICQKSWTEYSFKHEIDYLKQGNRIVKKTDD